MSKYRIKVDCLEPGASVGVELAAGLECDGFAIITDNGVEGDAVVNGTTVDAMSQVMAQNGYLRAAAVLADARARSQEIMRKYRMEQTINDMIGRMDE